MVKPAKVDGVYPTSFNLDSFNKELEKYKNENFCCETTTWRN